MRERDEGVGSLMSVMMLCRPELRRMCGVWWRGTGGGELLGEDMVVVGPTKGRRWGCCYLGGLAKVACWEGEKKVQWGVYWRCSQLATARVKRAWHGVSEWVGGRECVPGLNVRNVEYV